MKALPSLKQLRYLVALAETGHFGKAAEACHITQPSLSAAIADLEGLLDAQLVERNRRQVIVTPLGRQVVAQAQSILNEVAALGEMARAAARPLSGPIRMGVIPTIGPYLLPDLIAELRHGFPELVPFLREDQTAHLVDQLHAGKLDLALLALPVDAPWLEQMDLFDDPFVFACPRDHKLSRGNAVALDDLSEEKLLLLEDGHCLRDQALAVCGAAGRQKGVDFEANSLSTLVQMVASGLGVTLLPAMSLSVEARRRDELAVRPFTDPVPSRKIGLAWRRTSGRKSEYRQLGAYLKTRLPALCGPAPQP